MSTSDKYTSREKISEEIEEMNREFTSTLESFAQYRHEMIGEKVPPIDEKMTFEESRTFHDKPVSGRRIKPFVKGDIIEPLGRVKLKEGTTLVIRDDDPEFKEPIVSPKMQKNLRTLELRLDAKGKLYSPKAFDPEWSWESQAIWLRLIGLGYADISKKIGKSLNTVKSMFKRLSISKFFPRISKKDFTTIGYGEGDTPSGWRIVLQGGSSGILYPTQAVEVDERLGHVRPVFLAKLQAGEILGDEYVTEVKPFNLKKHRKESIKRVKEAEKRKKAVTVEQKRRQIESLKKNIAMGFNPETGKYDGKS